MVSQEPRKAADRRRVARCRGNDGDDLAHGNETCTPYPYLRYDSGPSKEVKRNVPEKVRANRKKDRDLGRSNRPKSATRYGDEGKSKK